MLRRSPAPIALAGLAAALALAGCAGSTDSDVPPLGDPAYQIVYSVATADGGGFTGPLFHAFVAGADGRWARRLLREDVQAFMPRWSPDGRRVAFSGYAMLPGETTRRNSVYVVNADGSGLARVPSDMHLWGPEWSPDGERLLVHYTRTASDFGFATVRVDGSELATIPGRAGSLPPSWSPDGAMLLVDGWTGRTDGLFVKDVDDGDARVLADSATQGRWSPDGRSIVFAATRTGGTSGSGMTNDGIWIMNADGTGRRRLTTLGHAPSWSPDGASIVYITWRPDSEDAALAVVSASGGAPREIVRVPARRGPGAPDWRPSP